MLRKNCKICKWFEVKEKMKEGFRKEKRRNPKTGRMNTIKIYIGKKIIQKTPYCKKWKKKLETLEPCETWEINPKYLKKK